VPEQGLALDADGVGGVQDINAFTVRLSARTQETNDADAVRFWELPFSLVGPLHARVIPRAQPGVLCRWRSGHVAVADGASPLPGLSLAHKIHVEGTVAKGREENHTPDVVGQLEEEACWCVERL
jgi:hypothetical protein